MRQQQNVLPPHIKMYAETLVNLEGVTTDKANKTRQQTEASLKAAAEAANIPESDIRAYQDQFRKIRDQQRDAARQ